MYTEKERILSILSGEKADRIPLICSGGMMSMANIEAIEKTQCYLPEAHSDPKKMANLVMAMNKEAGFENLGVPFCMTVEAEAFGSEVDYGSSQIHPRVVKEAIQTIKDAGSLKKLNPQRQNRMPVILDAISYLREMNKEIPIIGNLVGPASLAGMVLDPLLLFRLMRKDKASVHQLLSFITDNLIEFGKAQVERGVDIIAISEPTGTGEILGPEPFSEFVIPYVNRITGVLRSLGVKTIVHICGNIRAILAQMLQLEADCISVDAMVSIRTVKKHKKDLVLMGNVSTFLLEKGTPNRVTKTAKAVIKQGVDILAPACGLSPLTPTKNIRALLNVVCANCV